MAEPWDVIIVGQGLAGTTLAWCLRDAGQRVLVIDADVPVTSSRIAAGLITPITGQRLVLSWRCGEFLPEARAFYARIEKQTGEKFFHDRVALRLFQSDEERANWARRSQKPEYKSYLVAPQPEPLMDSRTIDASCGGFTMRAAQLDVAAYLAASGKVLDRVSMTVDWKRDVALDEEGVSVGEHRARHLISCEGYAATRNPYFDWVPFIAAKGDILTVKFHAPVPARSIHRGIWLAPTANPDIFRVGSTYDWETLDTVPDAAAREELERKLKAFFHVPYTVLDHHAAVRPIISESKPLIGLHPEHERLGFFNGLGSKGALLAPWYSRCFAGFLTRQGPLPAEADVQQHFPDL